MPRVGDFVGACQVLNMRTPMQMDATEEQVSLLQLVHVNSGGSHLLLMPCVFFFLHGSCMGRQGPNRAPVHPPSPREQCLTVTQPLYAGYNSKDAKSQQNAGIRLPGRQPLSQCTAVPHSAIG